MRQSLSEREIVVMQIVDEFIESTTRYGKMRSGMVDTCAMSYGRTPSELLQVKIMFLSVSYLLLRNCASSEFVGPIILATLLAKPPINRWPHTTDHTPVNRTTPVHVLYIHLSFCQNGSNGISKPLATIGNKWKECDNWNMHCKRFLVQTSQIYGGLGNRRKRLFLEICAISLISNHFLVFLSSCILPMDTVLNRFSVITNLTIDSCIEKNNITDSTIRFACLQFDAFSLNVPCRGVLA